MGGRRTGRPKSAQGQKRQSQTFQLPQEVTERHLPPQYPALPQGVVQEA